MINAENKGGLNVTLLEPGTKLTVETKNSIYSMEVIEGRKVKLSGGMDEKGNILFPEQIPAILVGSTWGGASLKIDWIGQDMFMEIMFDQDVLTTSIVRNVEIEAPDGKWFYSMDWNK